MYALLHVAAGRVELTTMRVSDDGDRPSPPDSDLLAHCAGGLDWLLNSGGGGMFLPLPEELPA